MKCNPLQRPTFSDDDRKVETRANKCLQAFVGKRWGHKGMLDVGGELGTSDNFLIGGEQEILLLG